MYVLLARVLLYIVSNIVSVPTFVILCSYTALHRNFRTILVIITISGNVISVMSYVQCYFIYVDKTEWQNPTDLISIFLYISTFVFVFANLCLTLERLLAVHFVAHYEKYSSNSSAAAVTAFVTLAPATATGLVVCLLQTDVMPVTILLLSCSTISAVVSLALRVKTRSSKVVSVDYSLRKKFQWEENQRTTPLYLYISLNEGFSAVLIAVVMYAFSGDVSGTHGGAIPTASDDHLADAVDIISAYRILFTHVAVIYYHQVQQRERGRNLMMDQTASQNTEHYFASIRQMWK